MEETKSVKEETKSVKEEKYTITWVDGNEYDVVINENGIHWEKKSKIPFEEDISN